MIRVIGDTHDFQTLVTISKYFPTNILISVGDNGIGFGDNDYSKLPENTFFISGNHDNPNICSTIPKYLGRFGIVEQEGINVLYISGACSVDKNVRTPGVDYWYNEELGYTESTNLLNLLTEKRDEIDIVISHDCPGRISNYDSFTGRLLDVVHEILDNNYITWFYGHHHKNTTNVLNGVTFIGLGINEVYCYNMEKNRANQINPKN